MPLRGSQSASDGVVDGQRVDDAGTRQLRNRLRQPREAFGLIREMRYIERQALAIQRAAQHHEIVTQLIDDILHHAIVGGRRRAQHRNAPRQEIEDAGDAPVVGAEVVTPVADAMRLVDHEQPDRSARSAARCRGTAVGEAFGRDQQEIDPSASRSATTFSHSSVLSLVTRAGPPAAFAGLDLVAHEAEQGRDEQGRPCAPCRSGAVSRRSRPRLPQPVAARRAPAVDRRRAGWPPAVRGATPDWADKSAASGIHAPADRGRPRVHHNGRL